MFSVSWCHCTKQSSILYYARRCHNFLWTYWGVIKPTKCDAWSLANHCIWWSSDAKSLMGTFWLGKRRDVHGGDGKSLVSLHTQQFSSAGWADIQLAYELWGVDRTLSSIMIDIITPRKGRRTRALTRARKRGQLAHEGEPENLIRDRPITLQLCSWITSKKPILLLKI